MRLNSKVKLAAALVAASALAVQTVGAIADGPADSAGVVHGIEVRDGRIVSRTQEVGGVTGPMVDRLEKPVEAAQPAEKVQPELVAAAAQRPAATERVIVTFADDVAMPRFPEPAFDEDRSSPANTLALEAADRIVASIKDLRAPSYAVLAKQLEVAHGARVVETFWLIKGMVVELPLAQVAAVAARPDVQYVQLELDGSEPPADTNPDNDLADGRGRVRSDPYFNLGLTSGWIGLLDTGIRTTHQNFVNPDHIALTRSCTSTTDCSTSQTTDPCNHGTASAGILTGNANSGAQYRGVSAITVDVFDVYNDGPPCGLNTTAAVRGFQKAVNMLDKVIVAEMQASETHSGSIATAADAAFDAGSVVVAANGNCAQKDNCTVDNSLPSRSSTVRSPAIAHKVLGIGAVDVQTLATPGYQSLGPTADNRIKPDVQMPTNTESSRSSSNTAISSFGGTSGAVPYAGGTSGLVRNFLKGSASSIDPGRVNAFTIMSGTRTSINNTNGAGRVELPLNGNYKSGAVNITNGSQVEISLSVPSGADDIEAAIWWPEPTTRHSDVDVRLVDPSGVVRASGLMISSVFERVARTFPVSGTWKLRINGYSVPSGVTQTVYYATHVTN